MTTPLDIKYQSMVNSLEKEKYVSKEVQDCCGNLTASRFCFSYHSSLGQKVSSDCFWPESYEIQ